jgi:hypothetical protein
VNASSGGYIADPIRGDSESEYGEEYRRCAEIANLDHYIDAVFERVDEDNPAVRRGDVPPPSNGLSGHFETPTGWHEYVVTDGELFQWAIFQRWFSGYHPLCQLYIRNFGEALPYVMRRGERIAQRRAWRIDHRDMRFRRWPDDIPSWVWPVLEQRDVWIVVAAGPVFQYGDGVSWP